MPISLSRTAFEHEAYDVNVHNVATLPEVMDSGDGSAMKETTVEVQDMEEVTYKLPVYSIFMFKKGLPAILFYLSHSVNWALDYLGVSQIISFESSMDDRGDNEVWFPISAKCYIRVKDRDIFLKYKYIQSVVGGILSVISNRFNCNQLDETEIWIKKLGTAGNLQKGYDMLTFYNRLLDKVTQKVLMIDDVHKKDIYSLVRWISIPLST